MKMKDKADGGCEYEAGIEAMKQEEKAAGGKKAPAQAMRPRWKIVLLYLLAFWVLGFALGWWWVGG